jgi:hypothetical protein
LVAAALAVAVLGAVAWGFGIAGDMRASSNGSRAIKAVTRAAQQLSSDVATSARAVLPLGDRLAAAVTTRHVRPHIVPSSGNEATASAMRFTFNGLRCTITPHVSQAIYWGAKRSTRFLTQYPGESDDAWVRAYYHAFADDPAQKVALDDACTQLRIIKATGRLSQDQYLELIVKYIQSIPYDWKSFESTSAVQRFPVEVLVERTGMCGDKSVLLAALLAHEGYAVCLLDFAPERHMAVGVLGPGDTYKHSGYLFVETTSPSYVTDVPDEYANGMRLTSEPNVVQIGSGTLQYSAADQVKKIIAARDGAKPAADKLYAQSKSKALNDPQVTEINRKLRLAYTAQISLRANVVDRTGASVGKFMDRTFALSWITRNAWWMQ